MNESVTELQNLWLKIDAELKKNIEDPRFFDVFLVDSFIHNIDDNNNIVICVNSNFALNILSNKYKNVILDAAQTVFGKEMQITFTTKDTLGENNKKEDKPAFFKNSIVNTALTFDSFITGPSNIEAKQAALYIATNPGKNFNPMFIFSNPGLGKTHLLHAIVNYIHETQPGLRVLYCETAEFVQEFVSFITGVKQQDTLKEFITGFDVFLIDDIQGMATREKTAWFFFEIFNLMHSHGKQIVISSDKHPDELKGFEERLKSRFASGLTVQIKQPDTNTCVGILTSKIKNSPLDINSFDQDVIQFIATKFSKNIREIDSAFNKLLYYVTIFKPTKHVDMDIAIEALQSLIDVKDTKQKLNEQRIINTVAEYYNVTVSQLTSSSRQGTVAMARHIAMYLMRVMLDVPYTRIGYMLGGKDHSTVMSGVEKVEKMLKVNSALETAITELKTQLKS